MRARHLVAPFVVMMLSSGLAFAGDSESTGDDEVILKSGKVLRGKITDLEPDEEVTIVVNGKKRTLDWSKVKKVSPGKYKEAEADEEEEEKPKKKHKKKHHDDDDDDDDDDGGEDVKGVPTLHIESNYPGTLLQRVEGTFSVVTSRSSGMGMVSRTVCAAPCDEPIDGRKGAQFFFTAPGMVGSEQFSLGGRQGDVTARVQGGSAGKRIGGIILTSVGGPFLIMGAGFAVIDGGKFLGAGLVYGSLGVGAVALGAGIYMWATSGTKIEILPATSKNTGVYLQGGTLHF